MDESGGLTHSPFCVLKDKDNGKERCYFYDLKALSLGQENSQSGCLVLSLYLR